jgi:hypothetical protein
MLVELYLYDLCADDLVSFCVLQTVTTILGTVAHGIHSGITSELCISLQH